MIPKTIYCIWISDKPMPEVFKKYIQSWHEKCPDYEIRNITLDNTPQSDFVNKCLERKQYTIANHYVRCQVVYENGGIYLDLDIQCVKNFDEILDNKMFVGWEDAWVVNNAVFGAEAKHPFLKDCMDYIESFNLDDVNVELETGPRMFTKFYKETVHDVTSMSAEYFYPFHYTQEFSHSCITHNTITIHHWAKSWCNPKISVIIPCYKYEHLLEGCLSSVLNNDYENKEIIVVDDGSPGVDGCESAADICKKINKGIICVTKPNGGLSSARNAGIRLAKGEYIMCLDADDMIPHDSLRKHMSLAGEKVIAQLGMTEFNSEHYTHYPEGGCYESIILRNTIYCNAVFSKKMWEKVGGYDESETMRLGCEDWELWVRLLRAGCVLKTMREVGLFYNVHPQSMTRTTTKKNIKLLHDYITKKNQVFELVKKMQEEKRVKTVAMLDEYALKIEADRKNGANKEELEFLRKLHGA